MRRDRQRPLAEPRPPRLMPRAPTEQEILRTLNKLGPAPTLLALADRLWPKETPFDLVLSPWAFRDAPVPIAPVVWLLRRLRSLCSLGHLVLVPCPGCHCHGPAGSARCPLLRVEVAPWPRAAQGPIWGTVTLEAPGGELRLEVLEPHPAEEVALGRLFVDGCPSGLVRLDGAGEGVDLQFVETPGCGNHLQPSKSELFRLAELVEVELRSEVPRSVLEALRPDPPPRRAMAPTDWCDHG